MSASSHLNSLKKNWIIKGNHTRFLSNYAFTTIAAAAELRVDSCAKIYGLKWAQFEPTANKHLSTSTLTNHRGHTMRKSWTVPMEQTKKRKRTGHSMLSNISQINISFWNKNYRSPCVSEHSGIPQKAYLYSDGPPLYEWIHNLHTSPRNSLRRRYKSPSASTSLLRRKEKVLSCMKLCEHLSSFWLFFSLWGWGQERRRRTLRAYLLLQPRYLAETRRQMRIFPLERWPLGGKMLNCRLLFFF